MTFAERRMERNKYTNTIKAAKREGQLILKIPFRTAKRKALHNTLKRLDTLESDIIPLRLRQRELELNVMYPPTNWRHRRSPEQAIYELENWKRKVESRIKAAEERVEQTERRGMQRKEFTPYEHGSNRPAISNKKLKAMRKRKGKAERRAQEEQEAAEAEERRTQEAEEKRRFGTYRGGWI